MVLDFANESDEIKAAFEPYYETTILSEATDPNLLYEKQGRLGEFPVFTETDMEDFATIYFGANSTQDRLYAALAPAVERFNELHEDEGQDFRSELSDYVRLYSFLAQVLPFSDVGLEKLYAFARHLRRLLPHIGRSCLGRFSRTSTWSPIVSSRPGAGRSHWTARAKRVRSTPWRQRRRAKARQRSWRRFHASSPSSTSASESSWVQTTASRSAE